MMIYVLLAILGTVFGSFYLVVATRMPNEESLVLSRSHCDNCKHVLAWYELIPIFSYLFLHGKCKKCGAKIGILAPIIEIVTALCFCLAYYLYGFNYSFYAMIVLLSLTIIIFISDFKYYIINDEPLFFSIILILILKTIFFGYKALAFSVLSGALMFLLFLLIKLFGDKAFKKESLGGGDIKLSILIGVTLGIKLGLVSFVLSAFIALPYAVIASFKNKEGIVPYGPFLITSLVIVFIFMKECYDFLIYLFQF